MTYRRYAYLFALVSGCCLALVAAVNVSMDPAGIYPSFFSAIRSPKAFASALVHSEHGLEWPADSWNIREIKQQLAITAKADCAIFGSSHAMQLGSFLTKNSSSVLGEDIVNLAVSGGGLEDILALSWELEKNPHPPQHLVYTIDPWTLSFGADQKFLIYRDSYESMLHLLSTKQTPEVLISNREDKLTNLINPHYFIRSLGLLFAGSPSITPAPHFDYATGHKQPVLLPDGAIAYSAEYITKAHVTPIPIGGQQYHIKSEGPYAHADAVHTLQALTQYFQSKGYTITFLMTPYHPNAWTDEQSSTVKAMLEVEAKVRHLGRALNIQVLGSFAPDCLDCTPNEFYDDMHATRSCLEKIFQRAHTNSEPQPLNGLIQ